MFFGEGAATHIVTYHTSRGRPPSLPLRGDWFRTLVELSHACFFYLVLIYPLLKEKNEFKKRKKTVKISLGLEEKKWRSLWRRKIDKPSKPRLFGLPLFTKFVVTHGFHMTLGVGASRQGWRSVCPGCGSSSGPLLLTHTAPLALNPRQVLLRTPSLFLSCSLALSGFVCQSFKVEQSAKQPTRSTRCLIQPYTETRASLLLDLPHTPPARQATVAQSASRT